MIEVTAAILIREDKVLIAKRKAGDRLAGQWEFPGGKIKAGETPQECLKREMEEELCIEVSVGEFIGESVCPYAHGSIRLLAYRTDWTGGEIQPKVHAEYRWVRFDQLSRFEFSAADLPFVEKLSGMKQSA
ncbi:MAG: (deoxy)nucleoside triphosphate pyrophosphohydrolase [Desulfobacteraceae bacterium]|nr:MAG: (deoxy)nucleoside triphosphate pyrophosphohydrolase [Desulfobacteraceae bacterium]